MYCFQKTVIANVTSSRSWILFQNFYFTSARSRGRNASRRLMWNYGRVAFFFLFFLSYFDRVTSTLVIYVLRVVYCVRSLKDVLYPIYERDRMTHAGETLYCHPMLPLNVNVRHRSLNRSSILSFSPPPPSSFFLFLFSFYKTGIWQWLNILSLSA